MDAVAVKVVKAVVSHIETAVLRDTLSQKFILERSYADWELPLEAIGALRVDVALVTTKQETELNARGGQLAYTVPVDLCVRVKLQSDAATVKSGRIAAAAVDPYMLLVEQLHELFTPERLSDYLDGIWQETKILAAPITKHLREMRQFTAILRITFRAEKDLTETVA